jgi:hypothetical protein
MTLRVSRDELSWVAPSDSRERTGHRQRPHDDRPKVGMNALIANPCSLNLVPPAKKQKPRTCVGGSGQVSQGYRIEHKTLTSTKGEAWFQ